MMVDLSFGTLLRRLWYEFRHPSPKAVISLPPLRKLEVPKAIPYTLDEGMVPVSQCPKCGHVLQ